MKDKSKKYLEKLDNILKITHEEIDLIIGDSPKASKSPRKGRFSFYVPDANTNKKNIRKLIKDQIPEDFEIGLSEVYIDIKCYVKTLSSLSKVDKELAEDEYIRPISKPDVDNYMKTYLDAFNGLLWLDDGQVVDARLRKYYSEEPRVEINIKFKRGFTSCYLERMQRNKMNK